MAIQTHGEAAVPKHNVNILFLQKSSQAVDQKCSVVGALTFYLHP